MCIFFFFPFFSFFFFLGEQRQLLFTCKLPQPEPYMKRCSSSALENKQQTDGQGEHRVSEELWNLGEISNVMLASGVSSCEFGVRRRKVK